MSALLDLVRLHRAELEAQAVALAGDGEDMLLRRAIRSDLAAWCRFCGFEPAAHHRLLLRKLEQLACGLIDRLAIFMPPGSAKSTYASHLFPPFYLANHPRALVLGASHTTELAERWSRRVRNEIADHALVLGISLDANTTAAARWALEQGGEYKAAGAGTAISGFRADLVIIDDPIRSREDADSETVRNGLWEWYKGDVSPRVKPGARWILIQTRWNEDDLAGRLLEEMQRGGDRWEVLSLPAEAEANDPLGRKPGEMLWDGDPNYKYGEFLRHEKATQLPRNWSALYQQKPTPDTGDYFKAEWLKPYDKAPARATLTTYGASDYAVTDAGGDYTVHLVVGIDPEDNIYLLDLWREQSSPDKWVESFCDLVTEWKPMGWAEEQGQIKASVGPFLDKRQHERKACVTRDKFPTRGDKAVRAQSIRGRMALHGLHVPIKASWYPAFRAELLSFPAGKHDDQVDALGLIGQLLDLMVAGRAPTPRSEPQRDGYAEMSEKWDERLDPNTL